ncbi:hypothetical protein HYU11_04860 [Candidatus Woesearchaeota archaeon]|nr:hypothetical protein [Candidatus Woesearchaeota archaeon]
MTVADTSCETISRLFFSQIKGLSIQKRRYHSELDEILATYAPDSARLLKQRLGIFK